MLLPDSLPKVGYVLKMYPRFSETFVLTEMLAMESAGAELAVFSLRQPVDGRFHSALSRLRAPVTYLPHRFRAGEMWQRLAERRPELPELDAHFGELLRADADEAVAAVELACRVRQQGIEHLHAHFGSSATTVARLAAGLAGVPYSFTAHAKDIFHESVDPSDLATKLADAAFVITVSDYNLDYLRDRFGRHAKGVVRLYNGLDLTEFRRNFGPRAPRVAAVGRLVEKKGFADLIEAIAELRAGGMRVPLDIAGTGPEELVLRSHAAALGVSDLVTFHGALAQHEVVALVASAAVFAAPCVVGSDGNRDGLPTVLLEAQALGTPVISTPVTGIPEAVQHGRTGLLVPEHDPLALAQGLRRLLTDPEFGLGLADGARSLIEERFDTRRNSAELLDRISGVVAARQPIPVAVYG